MARQARQTDGRGHQTRVHLGLQLLGWLRSLVSRLQMLVDLRLAKTRGVTSKTYEEAHTMRWYLQSLPVSLPDLRLHRADAN
jgi:hypothetical protein